MAEWVVLRCPKGVSGVPGGPPGRSKIGLSGGSGAVRGRKTAKGKNTPATSPRGRKKSCSNQPPRRRSDPVAVRAYGALRAPGGATGGAQRRPSGA